jgi:hypothetical protein
MEQYIKNIDNFTKTNEPKPEHGYYPEGNYTFNHNKYLIKGTNYHCFYNNEVYLLTLMREILGEKNSSECILIKNNDDWKIGSRLIENTENIYQFLELNKKCDKPAENFVSSMLLSVILGNIDPNSTNILIQCCEEKNKFYLIDPLIISQNNKFGIDANKLQTDILNLYSNFIKTTNRSNLRENLTKLFVEYFTICNDDFLKKVIIWIEDYIKNPENEISDELKDKNIKTIGNLKKISNKNDEMINNLLGNLINSMSENDIIQEISLIKGITNKQKENIGKLSDYFESEKNFPGFGQSGIKKGYANEVIERIEKLKEFRLSELEIGKNQNLCIA